MESTGPGGDPSRGPAAAGALRGSADRGHARRRRGQAGGIGNRYNEPDIELQIATRYRNVFGLTADRFRIEDALEPVLATRSDWLTVKYDVRRVYGDAELVDPADPSKKASHPC